MKIRVGKKVLLKLGAQGFMKDYSRQAYLKDKFQVEDETCNLHDFLTKE